VRGSVRQLNGVSTACAAAAADEWMSRGLRESAPLLDADVAFAWWRDFINQFATAPSASSLQSVSRPAGHQIVND